MAGGIEGGRPHGELTNQKNTNLVETAKKALSRALTATHISSDVKGSNFLLDKIILPESTKPGLEAYLDGLGIETVFVPREVMHVGAKRNEIILSLPSEDVAKIQADLESSRARPHKHERFRVLTSTVWGRALIL